MKRLLIDSLWLSGFAALVYCAIGCQPNALSPIPSPPATDPEPIVKPIKPDRKRRCPHCDGSGFAPDLEIIEATIKLGGPIGPDGKTEVAVDYPIDQRTKNVGGSDGAGLCVFTSIGHAARWQNEFALKDFQSYMKQYPGGGYPEKVTKYIEKICKDKGYVKPVVIQYEGKDLAILKAAIRSGRMPSVTYNGHDPHYSGTIAHMVNLAHLDEQWAVVLDNNFVGENELVWLTPKDFEKRYMGGRAGWCVILAAPPPPPPPRN